MPLRYKLQVHCPLFEYIVTLYTGAAEAALSYYWQCREETLRVPWSTYDGSVPFPQWLPTFFGHLQSFAAEEVVWARKVFSDGPRAVALLLVNTLYSLADEFRSRMSGASLAMQSDLLQFCVEFSGSLLHLFSQVPVDVQQKLLLSPTEPFAYLYDELPRQVRAMMMVVLSNVRLGDATTRLPTVVSRVQEATRAIFGACGAAIEHCGILTGGIAAQGLFAILNVLITVIILCI